VKLLALAVAALALASPASFLQGRQGADGGFAEPGGTATPGLTAWAAIGLVATGASAGRAHEFLLAHESQLASATDVELAAVGEAVTGGVSPALLGRLRGLVQPSGRIGPALNSTIWGILALRQAGREPPPESSRYLAAHQDRSGGFAWLEGGAPDSNTTAAAVEALGPGPVAARALAYLLRLQGRDGGFALSPGRGSDAQSTAWAIQAFLAAGARSPAGALAYLARLKRPDGSYRYSARYATTPVWVTAQVLPALAGRPLPLRTG
jgi:energy-coupling factor transport system substrate-specific component